MSQSTISVRIDSKDKAAFDSFCNLVGLNTSSVINMFVKKVILENRIPFEISAPALVSLNEGKNAFIQLRKDAKKNGVQGLPLKDINDEINKVRTRG